MMSLKIYDEYVTQFLTWQRHGFIERNPQFLSHILIKILDFTLNVITLFSISFDYDIIPTNNII